MLKHEYSLNVYFRLYQFVPYFSHFPVTTPPSGTWFILMLGLYNHCTHIQHGPHVVSQYTLLEHDSFPSLWKASLSFFALGLVLCTFSVLASLLAFCLQSLMRKSIFTVGGATQAL